MNNLAWENAFIATQQGVVVNPNGSLTLPEVRFAMSSYPNYQYTKYEKNFTVYKDDNNYVQVGNDFIVKINGSIVMANYGAGSSMPYACCFFLVNHETQLGKVIVIYSTQRSDPTKSDFQKAFTNMENLERDYLYTFITGLIPVVHEWQSIIGVSGIYGKVNFTQLENMTNGDPVSGASSSVFNIIAYESSVKNLVPLPVYNEWVDAIWSGTNVLRIKWTSSTTFSIQFAINSQPTISFDYTLNSSSDDAFIMLLMEVRDDVYYMRPSIVLYNSTNQTFSYNTETLTEAQTEVLYNWLVYNYNGDSVFGRPNEPSGGEHGNQIIEDIIDKPALPVLTALDTGWTKMYLFETTQSSTALQKLKDLAEWMDDFWENFINYIFKDDPMQALIAINISPIQIPTLSQTDDHHVTFLGEDTGILAKLISEQYFTVDCGECLIDFPSNHTYLDYAPYTKIKAVLPFVGTIDLNTDDIMGRKLKLEYVCDALTGTCLAFIYVYTDKGYSLHYQKEGTFLVTVPCTKTDFTQMISAITGDVANFGSSGITMGMASGLVGSGDVGTYSLYHMGSRAVGSGVNGALNVLLSHPNYVYMTGSSDGVGSYMGVDSPYLLIERPIMARPAKDQSFFGMPSYITGNVGDFSGFTRFNEVHLEDCYCTNKEYDEIMNNLTNGVIINSNGSPTPSPSPSSGNQAFVFIKNKSEHNVIGKTWTETTTLEGKLLYDQSIESPVLLITGDVKEYNYVYIPLFNRFYYVEDLILTRQTLQEVHLKVDPLQSFRDAILNSEGIAVRSGDDNTNYYINDNAIIVQQNLKVETVMFKKNGVKFKFNKSNSGFVVVLSNVNSHGST